MRCTFNNNNNIDLQAAIQTNQWTTLRPSTRFAVFHIHTSPTRRAQHWTILAVPATCPPSSTRSLMSGATTAPVVGVTTPACPSSAIWLPWARTLLAVYCCRRYGCPTKWRICAVRVARCSTCYAVGIIVAAVVTSFATSAPTTLSRYAALATTSRCACATTAWWSTSAPSASSTNNNSWLSI